MSIDIHYFPHILDSIASYLSQDDLRVFRTLSFGFKDVVDAHLQQHLIVSRTRITPRDLSVPVSAWVNPKAVRAIDLYESHPQKEEIPIPWKSKFEYLYGPCGAGGWGTRHLIPPRRAPMAPFRSAGLGIAASDLGEVEELLPRLQYVRFQQGSLEFEDNIFPAWIHPRRSTRHLTLIYPVRISHSVLPYPRSYPDTKLPQKPIGPLCSKMQFRSTFGILATEFKKVVFVITYRSLIGQAIWTPSSRGAVLRWGPGQSVEIVFAAPYPDPAASDHHKLYNGLVYSVLHNSSASITIVGMVEAWGAATAAQFADDTESSAARFVSQEDWRRSVGWEEYGLVTSAHNS